MVSRVLVTDQLHSPGIEVLLGEAHAFPKGGRHGLIEDFYTGTPAFIDLDSVESRLFFTATWGDGPDLAWLEGIATNAVFTLQFGRRDKLLYAISSHHVAEVGITEFRRTDSLLLFLDSTSCLHGDVDGPFDVFFGHFILTGIEELE